MTGPVQRADVEDAVSEEDDGVVEFVGIYLRAMPSASVVEQQRKVRDVVEEVSEVGAQLSAEPWVRTRCGMVVTPEATTKPRFNVLQPKQWGWAQLQRMEQIMPITKACKFLN